MTDYGKELVIDLHGCDSDMFTRAKLTTFFELLCEKIDMHRADLHFWDYESREERDAAPPHLAGISAVQFIETSNVTIHALYKLRAVYLNVFSCKDFNHELVIDFALGYFGGKVKNWAHIRRH